jgi:hypothetical protein
MFRFFGFLVYMYLTLPVLACHKEPEHDRPKTAKVRYMNTRKPKNQNMTGQNS